MLRKLKVPQLSTTKLLHFSLQLDVSADVSLETGVYVINSLLLDSKFHRSFNVFFGGHSYHTGVK